MRKNTNGSVSPLPDVGYQGPLLESGLGAGLDSDCLVAGLLPMGSGWAQPEEITWDPLLMGSPPAGGAKGVAFQEF